MTAPRDVSHEFFPRAFTSRAFPRKLRVIRIGARVSRKMRNVPHARGKRVFRALKLVFRAANYSRARVKRDSCSNHICRDQQIRLLHPPSIDRHCFLEEHVLDCYISHVNYRQRAVLQYIIYSSESPFRDLPLIS